MENNIKPSSLEQNQNKNSFKRLKNILRSAIFATGVIASPHGNSAEKPHQDYDSAQQSENYIAPSVDNHNYTSPKQVDIDYVAPNFLSKEELSLLEKNLEKISDNLSQKHKDALQTKGILRVKIIFDATVPVKGRINFTVTFLPENTSQSETVLKVDLDKKEVSNSYGLEDIFAEVVSKELSK